MAPVDFDSLTSAVVKIMEIEKLKLRFGDAALHVCDIMLKDLADSKRTNTRIQSERKVSKIFAEKSRANICCIAACQAEDLVTSILAGHQRAEIPSAQAFAEVSMCSQEVTAGTDLMTRRMQDEYANAYHQFRQDKKLRFYHQGTVAIEVHLQDRRLELEVTLLQAAILEAFSKRGQFPFVTRDPQSEGTGIDRWS